MDGIKIPHIVWTGDLLHELTMFKQYTTLIFKGPMSHLKTDGKMTYVLIWIGKEGLRIYNTWNNNSKTLAIFWNHISEVLKPRSNYRLTRLQIEKIRKSKDEPIDEFMTKCMLQAKKCKFRDETEIETRLIEQIIRGGAHDKVREDILYKDNTLTLDQAMKIARIALPTKHYRASSRSSKPAPTPMSIMLVTYLVIINLIPHIGRLIIASINHIMIRLLIIMLLVNISA